MPTVTKPPRKYKVKPPISALDSAAAQHRRQQSCKAQRAYRQRKEDTIVTLSQQIVELESTITRLSACFVGLNDKVLKYLEGVNGTEGDMLARGIGESMGEFKSIIDDGEGDADGAVEDGLELTVRKKKNNNQRKDSATQTQPAALPSPASEHDHQSPIAMMPHFNTEYPLQRHLVKRHSPPPHQPFSEPASYDLSYQPYQPLMSPDHLEHDILTPVTSPNQRALAYRLYIPTIHKAHFLLQTRDINDPVLRRVFATYYATYPAYEVKARVEAMMQRRNNQELFLKLATQSGWWSAVEVAGYLCSQGVWFDEGRDCCVVQGRGNVVDVGVLLDDIVVDAACMVDHPEYREETVRRVVGKIIG
ncbi:hypothetical protein E4T39_01151 [Aureobasidium subglaciale]|nr:hypothetical protein E4T39_01151 [Aureobasidium subglaciale]